MWGPLILCTFMATILQGHVEETKAGDSQGDGGPEFAEVFVIVWLGKNAISTFVSYVVIDQSARILCKNFEGQM